MPTRPPAPPPTTPAPPRDLPRLVMRRAAWVAAAVLATAVALGLLRVNQDIADEVDAAMTLAGVVAVLGELPTQTDATALARLAALHGDSGLRHLALRVRDAQGRDLLVPREAEVAPAWAPLLAWHRQWFSTPDARRVAWPVARPGGGVWTVELAASHEAERREALANLGGMLALLLLCVAGLLLAMRWNLARAFRPLDRLLAAISGIEREDARPLRELPTMPIGELEAVSAALRHLAASLDEAQARRQLLGQKVLTLQEDERAHLARELHDEWGQRLTAMRVDAAWLLKKLPEADERRAVLQGLATQCEQIQADLRQMLARLQPLGPGGETDDAGLGAARLGALLRALVASWHEGAARGGPAVSLTLEIRDPSGPPRRWPENEADEADVPVLPRPLALALYRLSQEALTNVARHAQATRADLALVLQRGPAPALHWQVSDDGVGLGTETAAVQRGNGLAGMQERAWALGSELQIGPARDDPARPGLRLAARFALGGPGGVST